MHATQPSLNRRTALAAAAALLLGALRAHAQAAPSHTDAHPDARWARLAETMKQQALSWGDQPYGAVLVLGGVLVGEGPSRVVKNSNPDAHAEREAIADAQRRLDRPGRNGLAGAVLYSTSRPCRACEAAAARAGVARMVFGPAHTDAGAPRADGH
jgi:tRNA(Arg) A34 adenosine deaminase TadA